MNEIRRSIACYTLLAVAAAASISHGQWTPDELLPPNLPWDGASKSSVVDEDDPWITPFEQSGLKSSPSYQETVAWLERLVAASERLAMVSLGKSPEQRDVWMVVATNEESFSPEALRTSNKPTVLAQAGIHSGEIDGKDAGMMLLRDMTVGGTKSELLDNVNFLFVPVFSVDGHERRSQYSRVNQRGPTEMGWRTTSRNLNLNRDYAKADTPEMQAMLRALNVWQPDLYLDLHVTDGVDYQYDITFGSNGTHGLSPNSSGWLESVLAPALEQNLKLAGHIPGPLVFPAGPDMSQGLVVWTATPRYSNGYGDARHLPTVLVENHSLKPFDQRVLGTYVLLEATLRTLGSQGQALQTAIQNDRAIREDPVAVSYTRSENPPETMDFLAIRSKREMSEITGNEVVRWLGEAETIQIPVLKFDKVQRTIARPVAYWVPPAWHEVIHRLAIHGIAMERIDAPRQVTGEVYRIMEPELGTSAFEGRVRLTAETTVERKTVTMAAGSVRVTTDQPLGTLAVQLLEPSAPDSFFQWGFFLEVLQRTEYAEAYALEPLARRMLESDPELEAAFEAKLESDAEFAESARSRLNFFYERSPFYDQAHLVYPVVREVQ